MSCLLPYFSKLYWGQNVNYILQNGAQNFRADVFPVATNQKSIEQVHLRNKWEERIG